MLSKVGLGTFVDPRLQGGRLNDKTENDLLEIFNIGGQEYLFYPSLPLNVAFIRATSADKHGNLTMDKEALSLDSLAMATAVKNNGGVVIAQVERIVENGSLNPKLVKVPGIMVDCVVVAEQEFHQQTYGTFIRARICQ